MAENKALRYNSGKPQWSLVEFKSLEPLVRVLEYGAHKYSLFSTENGQTIKGSEISIEESKKYTLISSGRDNWKLGLDKTEILESLSRHLFALMDGEKVDSESGISHIGHILCNALFYSHYDKELDINELNDNEIIQ